MSKRTTFCLIFLFVLFALSVVLNFVTVVRLASLSNSNEELDQQSGATDANPTTKNNLQPCDGNSTIDTHSNWWTSDDQVKSSLPPLNCRCKNETSTGLSCKSSCETPNKLRYIGPDAGMSRQQVLQILSGKNIVIVGDSVSRQWFETLVFYLGIPWSMWPRNLSRIVRNEMESTIGKVPMLPSGQVAFDVVRGHGVTLIFYEINNMLDEQQLRIISRHALTSIIVIDAAHVHFNERDYKKCKDHVDKIVEGCLQTGARCILRESLPQHFDTLGGLYVHGKKRECIRRVSDKMACQGKWRVQMLWERRRNLPVLSVFDRLAARGDVHFKGDCTHYYQDPEVWEPLHLALAHQLS